MAKVKIYLEGIETQMDAEDALLKAITHHSSGEVHDEASFDDPAMQDLSLKLQQLYKRIHSEMIEEISEVLDSDFNKLYGN